jgi:predicted dienelactone hydrolase
VIKKTLAALLVMLIAGVSILSLGKQPEPLAEGSESAIMLASHRYDFVRDDLRLVDDSRPTQANRDFKGAETRILEASYWYPVNDQGEVPEGKHPLVVYSHGFTSSRESGKHLGKYLASNGYIVIATDFPLTNGNAPGGPEVKDVVNQPGDVSFLIDSVIDWSQDSDHILFDHVDANRIGVTGISLGGMTTTLVSYHPTSRDPRIKAAASIAGPSSSFSQAFYENADIPFLMLAADLDALVPYEAHALPILDRVRRSSLVTITGGTHLGFAAHTGILRWLENADSIGCYAVLKNIETEEAPWHELVGTPEQGILYEDVALPCENSPLPAGMNPLRQHMSTLLAIYSFFESHFNQDAGKRTYFDYFLHEIMPKEIPEVSMRRRAT